MKRQLHSRANSTEGLDVHGQAQSGLHKKEWRGMKRREALQQLYLGNAVAENDEDLKNYFVETETFRSLIQGRADIIAGDKGTGKSALFKILGERYTTIRELKDIAIIPAFNSSGDPVFAMLGEGEVLSEGQYRTIWKAYILSLAGNWLLRLYEGNWTSSMEKLDVMLKRIGLREHDDTPSSIFSRLVALIKRLVKPKSAGVTSSFDEAGMPEITQYVEFGDASNTDTTTVVRHTDSLGLLNRALTEANLTLWLVLDRLDEAFAEYRATEVPALRALFRTYLDLLEFDRIKLKMFVRLDLFRKVTHGGFVNLSHINDKKVEIRWNDNDLLNLLIQRVRSNVDFMHTAGLIGKSNEEIFYALFPKQVEEGGGRPPTLKWMLTRISDGKGVKPPRNLIDLVKKAQDGQFKLEDIEAKDFKIGEVLIEGESIKEALSLLSDQRVNDTLLAESGKYREYIEKFRDGKAEHNHESLAKTLNLPIAETREALTGLLEMGFLARIRQSETFKVPMLYRDGLNITQGKAFQTDASSVVETESEEGE
jgi:hypothetical protein